MVKAHTHAHTHTLIHPAWTSHCAVLPETSGCLCWTCCLLIVIKISVFAKKEQRKLQYANEPFHQSLKALMWSKNILTNHNPQRHALFLSTLSYHHKNRNSHLSNVVKTGHTVSRTPATHHLSKELWTFGYLDIKQTLKLNSYCVQPVLAAHRPLKFTKYNQKNQLNLH